MSADNGVYILKTRGRRTQHGRKTEYRVAHAQAISNIQFQPDFPTLGPVLNLLWVNKLFGEALVFTDRKEALAYALAIWQDWMASHVVEYGIVELDYTNVVFPRLRFGKPRYYSDVLKEAMSD